MNRSSKREEHVAEFYELLGILERKLGGKRTLDTCHGKMNWPERGIYFFFEPGELRNNHQDEMRVVRVGTHAVSAGSKTTLWHRLSQHRGTNDGRGNHRGSVFRRHIGTALIAKSDGAWSLPTWGIGNTTTTESRLAETDHERRVSAYIRQMPFLWLAVFDQVGMTSHRAAIEANAIALLAGPTGDQPIDPPSGSWLGLHSPKPEIRNSGLWNVNYVGEQSKPHYYDPDFLRVMSNYVARV